MHKLMEYVCDELMELERKAEKDGKLSMSEIEYVDKLTRIKKNILKAEEMWDETEYSNNYGSYNSYANRRGGMGGRRVRGGANQYGSYAMDGYSRADNFRMELEELMGSAPNEKTKRKLREMMEDM